jgi:membrane protein insertase Oxa1/YidC/SpoIIIJ
LLGVGALTAWGASGAAAPSSPASQQNAMMVVAVGLTMFFLWSASSAVALSWATGAGVNVLQNWILNREATRHAV